MAGQLLQRVVRLGHQTHPMIQIFPNKDAIFERERTPVTPLVLFSHGLKSMKVNIIFHGQHNHNI
jgi:hypothetical protein